MPWWSFYEFNNTLILDSPKRLRKEDVSVAMAKIFFPLSFFVATLLLLLTTQQTIIMTGYSLYEIFISIGIFFSLKSYKRVKREKKPTHDFSFYDAKTSRKTYEYRGKLIFACVHIVCVCLYVSRTNEAFKFSNDSTTHIHSTTNIISFSQYLSDTYISRSGQ